MIVIEDGWSVQRVRAVLGTPDSLVLLRRRFHGRDVFLVWSAQELAALLSAQPARALLAKVLITDPFKIAPIHDLAHGEPPAQFRGVVIKGDAVVRITSLEPAPRTPPPSRPPPRRGKPPSGAVPSSPIPRMPAPPATPPLQSSVPYEETRTRVMSPAAPPGAAMASQDDEPVAAQPARRAFALLACAECVLPDEVFELAVGLSATPVSGVAGVGMDLPEQTNLTVDVRLDAPGFRFLGEGASLTLLVRAGEPYPVVHVKLSALPEGDADRVIKAVYSVQGVTLGLAMRMVRVKTAASQALPPSVAAEPAEIALAAPGRAPDLTVQILYADAQGGQRLRWLFDSPHAALRAQLPKEAAEVDLGRDAASFASFVIGLLNQREGGNADALALTLRGIADVVAEKVPDALLSAFAHARTLLGSRVPSVLLLSEEPYVPWELALVPLASRGDDFLCAQANVSRWVFATKKPKMPPPLELSVRSLDVFFARYGGTSRQPELASAAEEAAALKEQCKLAVELFEASAGKVLPRLGEATGANVLHFALHGIYRPNNPENGLFLADDATLDPIQVRALTLAGTPFVFLNACQVGAGAQLLGSYGGLAAAFLKAGASAVLAPLWSVRDSEAKEFALEFYRQALDGVPPGEALRRTRLWLRARHGDSSTWLAYQLFAHPHFTLDARHS